MPFWSRSRPENAQPDNAIDRLRSAVQSHLPDADDETVRIVTAITGLLGAVSYADLVLKPDEEEHIRHVLSRVNGLAPHSVDSLLGAVRAAAPEASQIHMHRLARDLHELTDRALRLEVLDTLVDLAASDDDLNFEETRYLRQVTSALGLSPDDYNASQQRHREKLSVLR